MLVLAVWMLRDESTEIVNLFSDGQSKGLRRRRMKEVVGVISIF